MNTWLKLLIVGLLAALNVQCSDEGDAKVSVTTIPDNPFVRTVDLVIDPVTTIDANWFRFSIKFENKTTKTFTIVGFDVEVFDSTGKSLGEVSFDSMQDDFTYWEEVAPGDTSDLGTRYGGNAPDFTIYGLSEPQNDNFRFRAVVEPIGWYGTFLEPTDRFSGFDTFFTR